MQKTAKFWDEVAEKYAKSPISNPDAYQYTLDRTRSYLTATDKILEVGCGTGSTALLLAENVDHVFASDISSRMIEIARGKAQDQGVSNATFMTAEQFCDMAEHGRFDALLALNLLHLLQDLPSALRSINVLLKPGGTFISKTVCKPGKGAPIKFHLMPIIVPVMQMFGRAPYVKFMAAQKLDSVIEEHGFKIVEAGDHPPPSRYVVARKIREV